MGSVGAARKVSPNWLQETMTCHSSNCFSIVWGQGNVPLVTSLPSSCYILNCRRTQLLCAFLSQAAHFLILCRDVTNRLPHLENECYVDILLMRPSAHMFALQK